MTNEDDIYKAFKGLDKLEIECKAGNRAYDMKMRLETYRSRVCERGEDYEDGMWQLVFNVRVSVRGKTVILTRRN